MDGGRALTTGRRLLAAVAFALVASLIVSARAHAVGVAVAVVAHPIPTADSGPTSLIVGPDGKLYFAESNVFQIGELDPAAPGTIHELGLPLPQTSTGDGDDGPEEITSSGGEIWAVTDDWDTIYAMTPDGTVSPPLHWTGSFATGVTPDDAGGVWLLDQNASDQGQPAALQRIDPPPPSYPLRTYHTDEINQQFWPLTTSPDGHVAWYAEDTVGQTDLVSIDDTGRQVKLPVALTNQTLQITSMAFSSNDALWFTLEEPPAIGPESTGGAVGELAAGSSSPRIVFSRDAEPPANDLRPRSLTPGPGGVMYFAYKNGIGQVSAAGQVTLGNLSPYSPNSVVVGPDGNLWFLDSQANQVGEVSPAALFGGPAGSPPGNGPGSGARTPAKKARLSLRRQRLSVVRRRRRLTARCTLASAGTCRITATVAARTARRLHLKVARKARTVTLARASRRLERRGAATLTLTLSRRVARALAHTRTLRLSIRATATATGHTPSRVTRRTVTLRR